MRLRLLSLILLAAGSLAAASCDSAPALGVVSADSTESRGTIDVLLTQPFCDSCSSADKDVLVARSPITAKVVALIDGASTSVDIAQFTFSVRDIEAAILRAHQRGVRVRIAMDAAQDKDGTVARRLRDAGIDLRFVRGVGGGGHEGIMHAKFMMVDGTALLSGSNNWSSTGISINEENTLVFRLPATDPRLVAHACQFETIHAGDFTAPGACSNSTVAFAPSSASQRFVRDALREARTSIDVLMHHFTNVDLLGELSKAAERGVRVRVLVNEADRQEHSGPKWDRLIAAGGRIRFKQSNEEAFQLMHHKLAIIDDRLLVNGSGNWSGSAFFKNFEVFARHQDPRILQPMRGLFHRLWTWSLSGESLDAARPAYLQHAAESRVFFGNLHAHFFARGADGRLMDDGEPNRHDAEGNVVPVEIPEGVGPAARHAFEYARDRGKLDFMALTPHGHDDRADDPAGEANMAEEAFAELLATAEEVSATSEGFLALAGMEWSTNSTGNHLGVFGSRTATKVERGRFDTLYEEALLERAFAGDRPMVMLAHPRTFATDPANLNGNWDQIFGVNLLQITKAGERGQKFNDFGLDDFPPLSEVHASWVAGDVLPDEATVQTTMRHIADVSAPYARLMEVTLNRGTELGSEVPQNPSIVPGDDGTPGRRTKVHTDWDLYLLRGFKLAPVATHDNHMANWGLGHTSRTGILAEGLDQPRFLTAIEQREVFASEDENLSIRLYADGRTPMGGAMATRAASIEAQLLLSDPDDAGPFQVRVFRGRVGGAAVEVDQELEATGDSWATFSVALDTPAADAPSSEAFFYVEVLEVTTDRMAWSAPIWVTRL